MLVLLPPSETKATGGTGDRLAWRGLSFPKLNPVRRTLVEAVRRLAADPPAALAALGLSERRLDQVKLNARLLRSPTMPAIARYTGVLYAGLDIDTLNPTERARADERLVIASALFGAVRAGDHIPAYRLSAQTVLPELGGLGRQWREVLPPALTKAGGLVVDLRSGAYQQLAPIPAAVTVRVLSERPDGGRSVVSHANKLHKGQLARALATAPTEPSDVDEVERAVKAAGHAVERSAPHQLDLIVPA